MAEANGEEEHEGYCIKEGCNFRRMYKAWADPYENLDGGDLAHAIIFGYTRPGEE